MDREGSVARSKEAELVVRRSRLRTSKRPPPTFLNRTIEEVVDAMGAVLFPFILLLEECAREYQEEVTWCLPP